MATDSVAPPTPAASTPSGRWVGDIWILAAIVIAFFALTRYQYSGHERLVELNNIEVIYSRTSTRTQAQAVAQAMGEGNDFGERHITSRIDFRDGRHELYLAVEKGLLQSRPQAVPLLKRDAARVCRTAFGDDASSTVWLCDIDLQPHTELMQLP